MLGFVWLGLSLATAGSFVQVQAQTQLLRNPGFEQPIDSSNWICSGCKASSVNTAYRGRTALLASNRMGKWSGPAQMLPVGKSFTVGSAYSLTSYAKLQTGNANIAPQKLTVTLKYIFTDGTVDYVGIVHRLGVAANSGWVLLASDFVIEDRGKPVKELMLYFEGPDPAINMLVDGASLTEIKNDGSWKAEARKRVESIRKGNLIINIQSSKPLKGVGVKVEQLTHEFGFGTALASDLLQSNAKFRQWYLDNFEWAVLENDMKWRQTEWKRGRLNWGPADKSMEILERNGKKVRGHAIFWADAKRNPDWLRTITSKSEFYQVCMKRVTDIVTRYKGRVEHWDVNNEMVPHKFYVDKYGSTSIRNDMFTKAKQVDPKATLFLNDYNIVNNGHALSAYIEQAQGFLAAKVPVEAIGAQGHFSQRPNGPVILSRLRQLDAVGLPIWITELDYANKNDQERANGLEDAMLAFFSHPSVNGVLLWGFYEGRHWRGKDAALVNGDDMTPNAAGKMWQRLFHKDWRSNLTLKPGNVEAGKTVKLSRRVFYGQYKVSVTVKGKILHTQQVRVSKSEGQARINIQLLQTAIGK